MLQSRLHLPVRMPPQPDETTCGPTCLHAIYRYWGEEEVLDEVIARKRKLERGGTVAVFLACDALRRGYQGTNYTCNLMVFDHTWFARGVDADECLRQQRQAKRRAHRPAGRRDRIPGRRGRGRSSSTPSGWAAVGAAGCESRGATGRSGAAARPGSGTSDSLR